MRDVAVIVAEAFDHEIFRKEVPGTAKLTVNGRSSRQGTSLDSAAQQEGVVTAPHWSVQPAVVQPAVQQAQEEQPVDHQAEGIEKKSSRRSPLLPGSSSISHGERTRQDRLPVQNGRPPAEVPPGLLVALRQGLHTTCATWVKYVESCSLPVVHSSMLLVILLVTQAI
ncbi:hypothetical protein CONLIGDRAFT_699090 [Coniochaeta ligniaria NRRL 30616]|uniref:Uncharacterized protein n=1 Tax=Coniochaeta ligniaria NRRL 30616 TaxID=1408157 RepID=A0A1J7IYL7_9PEZI|nr:hypothetical protein CONLIGDRAFT_699090 [Coniochaeta ligniaria NRRL 30616]